MFFEKEVILTLFSVFLYFTFLFLFFTRKCAQQLILSEPNDYFTTRASFNYERHVKKSQIKLVRWLLKRQKGRKSTQDEQTFH